MLLKNMKLTIEPQNNKFKTNTYEYDLNYNDYRLNNNARHKPSVDDDKGYTEAFEEDRDIDNNYNTNTNVDYDINYSTTYIERDSVKHDIDYDNNYNTDYNYSNAYNTNYNTYTTNYNNSNYCDTPQYENMYYDSMYFCGSLEQLHLNSNRAKRKVINDTYINEEDCLPGLDMVENRDMNELASTISCSIRLRSFIVDLFFLFLGVMFISFPIYFVCEHFLNVDKALPIIAKLAFAIPLLILYLIIPNLLFKGQTLGKKLLRIKVLKNDNTNVGYIYWLIRILFLNLIFFDSIYYFVSNKNISLSNLVTKTKTVYYPY